MPKTVHDKRHHKNIRLKESFNLKIKETAKDNNITETEIIEKGVEMYMKYLEEKDVNDG
jgi:hypothetical protein